MSYIKEKYADQIGSKITLDDVSGMKRAGPIQSFINEDDSWLEDTYIEDFTMPNLKKILDERIVGQEHVKKALAQTLYTTFEHNMATNVMLIGPTASGKTECCRAIANEFKKACYWCDCSILSGESYRGDVHLSTIIKGIPDDGRMKILFADEFDKLLFASSDSYPMKLQSEWLRLLDKDPSVFQGCVKPENLTIIATGAFSQIYQKKSRPKSIGFGTANTVQLNDITIDRSDLIEAGLLAELVGRFQKILCLEQPTLQTYKGIADRMLWSLAENFERGINIDQDDLYAVAQRALDSGLGARMIRSDLLQMIEDYLYEHPYARTVELSEGLVAEM